jgi:formylmethanofuran dehydrogenase subunit E
VSESIEEDILAVVECNNCFADGVQIATGCTFGNNTLIYHDLGKNALTLVRRSSWEGVRVYIDAEKLTENHFPKEATELFEKVVTKRRGDEEDRKRLSQMWEEIGYKMLEIPKEEFKIERVRIEPVEQAPIFKSVRCTSCGELAMKTRIVYIDEKPYCLKCAGEKYYAVIGRGIIEMG